MKTGVEQVQVPVGLRILVLFSIVAVPIYRMLLQHDYGFFHPEVAVITVALLVAAAAGALIARTGILFAAAVLLLSFVMSAGAIQQAFPSVQYRWILLGLAVPGSLLIRLMGRNFYTIVLVFLLGSFGVDVAQSALASQQASAATSHSARADLNHVIYLLLDEHIGIAGIPLEVPGGQATKDLILDNLQDHNFSVYPNAFANYAVTYNSVPSILGGRLGEETRVDVPVATEEVRLFKHYVDEGYQVRIYQSDQLTFRSSPPAISTRTYKTEKLSILHEADISWTGKLREIGVMYLATDKFLLGIYRRFAPTQSLEPIKPVAAGVRDFWPSGLLADITGATRKTVFFAHFLNPHFPYVFKEDGALRPPAEWSIPAENVLEHYDREEYSQAYQKYLEQTRFLHRQVRGFLESLRNAGILDSATIVMHGDHGSRIRLLNQNEREARKKLLVSVRDSNKLNRYDYVADPTVEDLLNRFSTLAAIKLPHAASPQIINDKASVLSIVWTALDGLEDIPSDQAGLSSVYLFDAKGSPRAIPILDFWKELK